MNSQSATVTTIDMLRHGTTVGGDIFRGSTDVALDDQGWRQMQQALQGMAGWQHIVSSPLQRCRGFAETLAVQQQTGHSLNGDLREIFFGDWEGKTYGEVQQADAAAFAGFWRDPLQHTPPNAEPLDGFARRVQQAFWQEVEQRRGQHLLLVVHGGVVRAILGAVLQTGLDSLLRFDVPYACLTRIKIYHDADRHWPQLVFHNRSVIAVE